jgi:hypothetical protein
MTTIYFLMIMLAIYLTALDVSLSQLPPPPPSPHSPPGLHSTNPPPPPPKTATTGLGFMRAFSKLKSSVQSKPTPTPLPTSTTATGTDAAALLDLHVSSVAHPPVAAPRPLAIKNENDLLIPFLLHAHNHPHVLICPVKRNGNNRSTSTPTYPPPSPPPTALVAEGTFFAGKYCALLLLLLWA